MGEKAILAAWLAGIGLLTWRELQLAPGKPPPAGRYLVASGLYALLGVVAAAPAAAGPAAAVAWAFNLALALQVLPTAAGGPAAGTGTAPAGGAVVGGISAL